MGKCRLWVNVAWVNVAMGICRMGICRLTCKIQAQAALEFDCSPLEDFSGQSSSTSSDIPRHNPPWFRPTGS